MIRVDGTRRDEAIAKLVEVHGRPDPSHARRFLEYTAQNRITLDGLWARLDQRGRITASVLVVPGAGRTAMVFATRQATAADAKLVGELINRACREISPTDVHLAQVLVDPNEPFERLAFLSGGFADLAALSYLERPVPRGRMDENVKVTWPAGVELHTYADSLRLDLVAILDASYEHTLDCPELRGLRHTEDSLAGHLAGGLQNPQLWTLLRVDGRWAGALLLNPSAGHQSIELVYLGLAAWARNRGLGWRLLRHGLELVRGRPERVINLAVDEANTPAIALYRREGFRPVLRRLALIRPVRDDA
jgi:ribosomal protein S18 acetylase RimI-like enzyme